MKHWTTILAILFLSACGHGKIAPDPQNVATKKGVISAWADWIKPKGKRYDMHFHVKNESNAAIVVRSGDMNCFRGATQGEMKYTFFNTGERLIDLGIGQDKGANLVCTFPMAATGDFRVVIRRVFDNPSNDGKTTVNVVAENIEWKQSDSRD